ncbi:MAG: hypothetical protein MJZ58_05745 [Paludibacteraceae bacterium]|nr:hypothetical protein [Paludibacteraceae bacterium]
MYHISSSKRTLDSAQKIESALNKLLDSVSLDRISVSQICKEAGVGRTTFYRLFDMPVDIIQWRCDTNSKAQYDELMSKSKKVIAFPFDFNLRYVFEHPQALELAYKAGRTDIAEASFNRYNSDLLKALQDTYHISNMDLEVSELIVTSIITSSFKHWIENGKKETINVFLERIRRIIQHL